MGSLTSVVTPLIPIVATSLQPKLSIYAEKKKSRYEPAIKPLLICQKNKKTPAHMSTYGQ